MRERTVNIRLDGKTAIVTGSTAGIGFAIAKGLAESGAAVVVNGRTERRVAHAVPEVKAAIPAAKVQGIEADLGAAEGAKAFIPKFSQTPLLLHTLQILAPTT